MRLLRWLRDWLFLMRDDDGRAAAARSRLLCLAVALGLLLVRITLGRWPRLWGARANVLGAVLNRLSRSGDGYYSSAITAGKMAWAAGEGLGPASNSSQTDTPHA